MACTEAQDLEQSNSPKGKPRTLGAERCHKWGSGLKGFTPPLKAALLQQSTRYCPLGYTKLCSYHQFQQESANTCRSWSHPLELQGLGRNLCPASLPSLPSLPMGTGSGHCKRAFTNTSGTQGQKLIRTIHKPGWRSAASHPWKFNCTQ